MRRGPSPPHPRHPIHATLDGGITLIDAAGAPRSSIRACPARRAAKRLESTPPTTGLTNDESRHEHHRARPSQASCRPCTQRNPRPGLPRRRRSSAAHNETGALLWMCPVCGWAWPLVASGERGAMAQSTCERAQFEQNAARTQRLAHEFGAKITRTARPHPSDTALLMSRPRGGRRTPDRAPERWRAQLLDSERGHKGLVERVGGPGGQEHDRSDGQQMAGAGRHMDPRAQ